MKGIYESVKDEWLEELGINLDEWLEEHIGRQKHMKVVIKDVCLDEDKSTKFEDMGGHISYNGGGLYDIELYDVDITTMTTSGETKIFISKGILVTHLEWVDYSRIIII